MLIPKVILAEVFKVTRSAITQSVNARGYENDLKQRIARYIFSNKQSKQKLYIQDRYEELLRILQLVIANRQDIQQKGAGRPKQKCQITKIRQFLRKFYRAMLEDLGLAIDTDETSDYRRRTIRITVEYLVTDADILLIPDIS